MAIKPFFVNKKSGRSFEVVGMDKEATPPTVTLKGEYSTFTEEYTKERMIELGYTLEKREVADEVDEEEDEAA